MIVVRKVFIIILYCLAVVLSITFVKIYITYLDNENIEKKITAIKQDNQKLEEDNLEITANIESVKETKKETWEELETWQKTKSKIETALSQ